jgi:hypothetical protein
MEGETGLIRFDEQKYRRTIQLSIMFLEEQGLVKVNILHCVSIITN